MIDRIKYTIILLSVVLLSASCASTDNMPTRVEKPQYSQRHYAFTVLLTPDKPVDSPRLEIGLSLLQVAYPEEQSEFLYELLYYEDGLDAYKDRVIREQRDRFRDTNRTGYAPDMEQGLFDCRYTERINVINRQRNGLVIERNFEYYMGDALGQITKTYYVINLEEFRHIKVDDIFGDFQGDAVRRLVYAELRKYNDLHYEKLERDQPLSEGIYLKDEPELSFNFFLSQEGIGLHWDSFEIAPYEEGSIEIILPWRSIERQMLSSARDLMFQLGIDYFIPEDTEQTL